ncbi:MAG: dTDP-4-dehydrorhamnose 3,5-epimerase [Oscillospiraceae bacterium]|nr:dTDP-4-dehydrorhamnose 3,5-epimerase [Oscillospiraceae bacterium]
MIKVSHLGFEEILILEYPVSKDNRGISVRTFSKRELNEIGIDINFVEEVLYCPQQKNTLYGIHFQNHPKAQTKLVYCTKGRILDFVVDLRKSSDTYKRWVCVELSPANRKQVYIPVGFGHAALTLENDTNIVFKISEYFDSSLSKTVKFDDVDLNIKFDIVNPILSQQDKDAPSLKESDCNL